VCQCGARCVEGEVEVKRGYQGGGEGRVERAEVGVAGADGAERGERDVGDDFVGRWVLLGGHSWLVCVCCGDAQACDVCVFMFRTWRQNAYCQLADRLL
jgi:hypothetical protein